MHVFGGITKQNCTLGPGRVCYVIGCIHRNVVTWICFEVRLRLNM